MAKILITGVTGFIGYAVASRLKSERQHDISILVFPNRLVEKTFSKIANSDLKTVTEEQIESNDLKYDIIVHCAGISDTTGHSTSGYYNINVKWPQDLSKRCKYFIYLSSMAVINQHLSSYAASKLSLENWGYYEKAGAVKIGLRIPNIFGYPVEEDHKIRRGFASPIATFIHQAQVEKKVKLYKTGAVRSFVNVHNLSNYIAALIYDLNKRKGRIKKENQILHLSGKDKQFSFDEIAELVSERFSVPVEIIPTPSFLKSPNYQLTNEGYSCGWGKLDYHDYWISPNLFIKNFTKL